MEKIEKLQHALKTIFQSNDAAFFEWNKNHSACKRCHFNRRIEPCICGPQPCRTCGSLTADIVNELEDIAPGICVNCTTAGIKELFLELRTS